jgi:hypothetical protein
MKHSLLLLSIFVTLFISQANGVVLDSCGAIRDYLKRPFPDDPYTRTEDLKTAVDYLDSTRDSCPIYDIERVRFSYAQSLDSFSRSFGDVSSSNSWASDAGEAYRGYVEWFLSLTSEQKTSLITAVTHKSSTSPDFHAFELSWIRRRMGGALTNAGNAFVFGHSYGELIDFYDSFSSECISDGPPCLQVVPIAMIRLWHKWLSTMPDYRTMKNNEQLKSLIAENPDCDSAWESFVLFLDSYLPANPSVPASWNSKLRRYRQWLAS